MSRPTNSLLADARPDATFAWRNGEPVSLRQFGLDVAYAAARLPKSRFAVNLCEDRYRFLVSFGATLVAGQVTLLPPNRVPRVIAGLVHEHPGAYCLTDRAHDDLHAPQHIVALDARAQASSHLPSHRIGADQLAAIVFTSGSTGKPTPSSKHWGGLVAGAQITAKRLGLDDLPAGSIVSTVPSQHMFGLEMSVMLPLTTGIAAYDGHPFFPADVVAALAKTPAPRILVSTPVHLRACLDANLQWPTVERVVSATATLPEGLARSLEQAMGAKVVEVYGCTEAGAIATRETAREDYWRLLDGLTLTPTRDSHRLDGPSLNDEVVLDDRLRLHGSRHFELLGRHADLVKVAGKRMSLNDLNLILNGIDGVEEGVFIKPAPDDGSSLSRLVAFVVAPSRKVQDILEDLAQRVDPVFLPRPLHKVHALPRSATGKVPREALLSLTGCEASVK
jgi:acyl-coenzyme A synthetase/AMP-(fatty) acid ligase